MQMRYQLRHSPGLLPAGPAGNSRNPSQPARRMRNRGPCREPTAFSLYDVSRRPPRTACSDEHAVAAVLGPVQRAASSHGPAEQPHQRRLQRRRGAPRRRSRRARARRGSRASAGTIRSRTCSVDSSPGTRQRRSRRRPTRRTPRGGARRTRRGSGRALAHVVLAQAGVGLDGRGRSASATYAAVCRARARSLDHSRAGPARRAPGRRSAAWRRPAASSAASAGPARGPRRSSRSGRAGARTRRASGSGTVGAGGDVGGQLDHGAVAPQPLEGVELPLLLVLHVHDDSP